MNYTLMLLIFGMTGLVSSQENPVRFLVGTTDGSDSAGVYRASLNPATGEMSVTGFSKTAPGPGYIALSPDKAGLFVVTGDHTVSSYKLSGEKMALVNSQPAHGVNPCHVSVLPSGKMIFLANYSDGSFSAYGVKEGFELTPAVYKEKYQGKGPNERRQEKAHAHCAVVSPDGRSVYVADLGTDKVMNYRVDGMKGKVEPNSVQPFFTGRPGAGPRHIVVHPKGKWLYLLNELDATITAISISGDGALEAIETYRTLPEGYDKPGNTSAAIRLHPNGKFLYVSNRGYDAIHGYRIERDGKLKKINEIREQVSVPRDFNIDPSGKFLIVGNLKTHNLTLLEVDTKTGVLTYRSTSGRIPSPSCVEFL